MLRSGLRNIYNFHNYKLLSNISTSLSCSCIKQINTDISHAGFRSFKRSVFSRIIPVKNWNILKRNLVSFHVGDAQNQKILGCWFLTCSGMVFGAVVLGGVTRLTESGLSMVSWRLLGEKRPKTEKQWLEEFEKYKQYPEFQIKNKEITLEEFKWIWRMEYIHRMWGRLTGAIYFIPGAVFLIQRRFTKVVYRKVLIMGGLLTLQLGTEQGLLGWYMVKSGLENRFEGPNDVPRVSQYRLAAHLTMAIVLYALFLRAALEHLSPALKWPVANKYIVPFKILAHSSKGLVYLTAISGAFVAGLDAGLVYNSFPKMGDKWIPEDIWERVPFVKNFTENPTTVQFDHRILGTTALAFISALWLWSLKFKLPPGAKAATNALVIMAYTQVGLGITTLLTYVPVYLGAMHQCGSLILLSLVTWLTHELKYVKKLPK